MEQTSEDGDVSARIGHRLAELRAARNLRVTELARRVAVSPSLISQIEHGQSRPSVNTLFALARELGVPVDAFFESERRAVVADARPSGGPTSPDDAARASDLPRREVKDPVLSVLHRHERPTIDIRGGVRWERLTPSALHGLDFMELVYQPGAESAPELYRHPGVEMVLVIENRLDIHVGFDRHVLGVGDSLAFASSIPHRYVNPTERVTRAVTVIVRDDVSTLRLAAADR